MKAPIEELYDSEIIIKSIKNFIIRIDELTDRNIELEMELEQWKSAASQAELLNCELGTSLEIAQSDANILQ
jgi:hypothetical protein